MARTASFYIGDFYNFLVRKIEQFQDYGGIIYKRDRLMNKKKYFEENRSDSQQRIRDLLKYSHSTKTFPQFSA